MVKSLDGTIIVENGPQKKKLVNNYIFRATSPLSTIQNGYCVILVHGLYNIFYVTLTVEPRLSVMESKQFLFDERYFKIFSIKNKG